MTNTMKKGYSVQDVAQILGCSGATVIKMVDRKDIECNVDDPKTVGGRRSFRFEKEHIQHYMLRHYSKFDDATLRTWGVMTQPSGNRSVQANRIKVEAATKPVPELKNTTSKPTGVWRSILDEDEKKTLPKPYLRTEEVKAEEAKAKTAVSAERPNRVNYSSQASRVTKRFPSFKITLDGVDIVTGIEPSTAGVIVQALMSDRNLRVNDLSITFDGGVEKEVHSYE